ncbi:MAG: cell division protein FtsA [Clostridium sp.]|nr:cell division protein FtsA [Clostridium sp.]
MAGEKELIVAIELGSSTIRGIAGKKNADGSIQVLDIAKEPAHNCIRKGVVYNVDKTVQNIRNIIQQLENSQHVHINKAYVGVSGQSLRTVKNSVSRQLDSKELITNELVDMLLDTNLNASYPDLEILDVVPQEYRIGNQYTTEPVGILSNHIEGRFLNIVARTMVRENIQKCFQAAELDIVDYFISPLALADNVLTDTEKRSGCALVDFGADTTTVAVFKNNILRHLVVIPLGGNNITQDICSLQMEEEDAEALKLQHGSAYTEPREEDGNHQLSINNDRTIEERMLQEIVEARMEEIIANVWEQICISGYRDQLLAGIIVTGGGANIKHLDKAFLHRTGFDKLKTAKVLHTTLQTQHPEKISKNGSQNTLFSLLTKGDLNCAATVEETVREETFGDTPGNNDEQQSHENSGKSVDTHNKTEETTVEPEKKTPKESWMSRMFGKIGKDISNWSKTITEE